MLRRFNLGCAVFFLLVAVVLLGLGTAQPVNAATISPTKLDRPVSNTIANPVHYRKYRHYHKRCRYCPRVYHTCPKK